MTCPHCGVDPDVEPHRVQCPAVLAAAEGLTLDESLEMWGHATLSATNYVVIAAKQVDEVMVFGIFATEGHAEDWIRTARDMKSPMVEGYFLVARPIMAAMPIPSGDEDAG